MKSAGGRSRFDFDKPSMRGGVAPFGPVQRFLGLGPVRGASERVVPAATTIRHSQVWRVQEFPCRELFIDKIIGNS